MQICAKSDRGMVRELNEDSFAQWEQEPYTVMIVADGMGGHNAGEVASSMAVQKMQEYIQEHLDQEAAPRCWSRQ